MVNLFPLENMLTICCFVGLFVEETRSTVVPSEGIQLQIPKNKSHVLSLPLISFLISQFCTFFSEWTKQSKYVIPSKFFVNALERASLSSVPSRRSFKTGFNNFKHQRKTKKFR